MHLSHAFVAFAASMSAARAQITPNNLVAASTSGALSALKYTNVGSTGSYDQVTNMLPGTGLSCNVNPSCITETKDISGNLAPFDDEMTIAFRGPLNLANIAVYQPSNASSASWNRVSSWAANEQPTNLVFMNNDGGSQSGEWSICGGSSQSYANGNWTDATTAANAEIASGYLDETHEINIMTAASCNTTNPCSGFSRGTANHGWAGSKFFVLSFSMPSSASASDVPAVWALNAQIVRAAQYGCNCRGTGPGGCGELDILEVLTSGNSAQGISEIYAPKGATGSGASYFARPTSALATYGVIMDEQTDSIAILQFTDWEWDQTMVTRSVVDGYLNAPAMVVSFAGSSGSKRADMPRSVLGAHRRKRHLH